MQKTTLVKSFLLTFAIVIFWGCHKTPIATIAVPGTVYSYFNLPYLKTNGNIIFEVNNTDNDHSSRTRGADFYGGFDNNGGVVNVAGYKVLPFAGNFAPNNLAYDSLYRKVITYSIMPPTSEGTALLTGSFYSPAPIYATNIPMPNQTPNYIPSGVPFSITWKADGNNTNGINIEADYFPDSFQNWDLAAKGDSAYLQNSIMLPDNGSIELSVSFFAKFPKGANLLIFIGRGNAVYVQNSQYVYLVDGFFRSSFFAIKK